MALYAFDGTFNKPDTVEDDIDKNTNVYNFLRFYAPHDPESSLKIEEYKPGVGTRLGGGGRIVGGFFGAGGRARVHEMIDSFRDNWSHNGPEDRVVDVIGFSRGGALAVHFCNQLAKGVKVGAETVTPKIRFLGVWDVVPSFGLPGIVFRAANAINIGWELEVPENVERCYHAMALDERRGAFDVHRLDKRHEKEPRIQEWWFRGVHSDVGGGNGNVLRGNIALVWMLQNAHECGLPIDMAAAAALPRNPNAPVSHRDKQGRASDREICEGDHFHETAGRTLAVGETARVDVDAALWFNFSGILVSRGEQYLLAPDPAGRWKDASIECSAAGWPENLRESGISWLRDKLLRSPLTGLTRRVREANWFEMVACVGTCITPAAPIGRGQHAQTPWTAPSSGPLSLFANDAVVSVFGYDFYDNNSGAIAVEIRRVR